MTLCTFPVAFSSTRMSFVPMKAMLVGWLRPKATFRTARFGSTTDGATRGSCAIAGRTRARARNAAPTRAQNITLVFCGVLCIEPPHGSRLGRRLSDRLAAYDWHHLGSVPRFAIGRCEARDARAQAKIRQA